MPSIKGYSLKEVANEVGVSRTTIVRWIETRKVNLPKKRDARGHYFYTESDLKRLRSYRNSILAGDPTTDAPPPPNKDK